MSESTHPHAKKKNWFKLVLTLAIMIFGIFTQFDLTINKQVGGPEFKVAAVEGDLVKSEKDGKMSKAECMGLAKHKDADRQDILDTFGLPENDVYSDGAIGFDLTDGDGDFTWCTLHFEDDDEGRAKLVGVTMDLWGKEN
jgi:hypothetical protein